MGPGNTIGGGTCCLLQSPQHAQTAR